MQELWGNGKVLYLKELVINITNKQQQFKDKCLSSIFVELKQ